MQHSIIPEVKVTASGVQVGSAKALENEDDDYFVRTYTGAEIVAEKSEIHVFETKESYSSSQVTKRIIILDYDGRVKGYLNRQ